MFWGKLDEKGRLLRADRDWQIDADFLRACYAGELEAVRSMIAGGAAIDQTDKASGLSALHIAVGTNNLALVRMLVEEHHAGFFADRSGRWPTLIAAECGVDDDLSDYILAAEARFLGQERSV